MSIEIIEADREERVQIYNWDGPAWRFIFTDGTGPPWGCYIPEELDRETAERWGLRLAADHFGETP